MNKTLDEKLILARKVQMAKAMLQRADEAGIPKEYRSIGPDKLKTILCNRYHKDIEGLVQKIYTEPNFLISKKVIAIDGGNLLQRKRAGFALLFRIITFDNVALYKDFNETTETLKQFNSVESAEIMNSMKKADHLFIGELRTHVLQAPPKSIAMLWDSIFEKRYDTEKTTIVSFSSPLPSSSHNIICDDTCGNFFPFIYNNDVNKELNVFRLRVKS